MLELGTLTNIPTHSFKDKLNYEAKTSLLNKRDKISIKKNELKLNAKKNIWERDPIDFNPSIYHPRPPKRNSKEAIKPWLYDKYLKPVEKTKDDVSFLNNRLSKIELFNEANYHRNNNDSRQDFQLFFRALSPDEDRFKAAQTNGFRDLIGNYKNPIEHDFRGVFEILFFVEFLYYYFYYSLKLKTLIGFDDFNLRFIQETNDKNKFLSQQLSTSINFLKFFCD